MERFTAYCYVMKKHDVFFAATPTLNLTAVGNSPEEAQRELHSVILSYLETVFNENFNLETDQHLLKRSAPFYMYYEYSLCALATFIMKIAEILTFSSFIKMYLTRYKESLPLTLCMVK